MNPLHHPHRYHHPMPWGCMGPPIPRAIKHSLRKRLFIWFGAAIVASGVSAIAVAHFVSDGSLNWRRQTQGAVDFVASQLSRSWEDPKARDQIAKELSSEVGLNVALLGPQGERLSSFGKECSPHSVYKAPVVRDQAQLGTVQLCYNSYAGQNRWTLPLALFAAGAVLWLIAGKVARRMSRPLSELARVADEIGQGNLSSRVRIRHGHGEVGVLADAINQMAERIEKQIADQRELLAAVSHELRTPLARLRLLTEIGRDMSQDAKLFDDVDQEVLEIDALVGDLLAKSRLDFASFTPKPLEAEAMAERALERAGLPMTKLLVDDKGLIFDGDATLVARALANLIENAKRHGGGLTCLRIVKKGDSVSFEAEDEGPGIKPGEEGSVFEAFQQGSANDRSGLGLGLALVKRIAEVHQGRAFAQNLPESGARVGIELPLTPRQRATPPPA